MGNLITRDQTQTKTLKNIPTKLENTIVIDLPPKW